LPGLETTKDAKRVHEENHQRPEQRPEQPDVVSGIADIPHHAPKAARPIDRISFFCKTVRHTDSPETSCRHTPTRMGRWSSVAACGERLFDHRGVISFDFGAEPDNMGKLPHGPGDF
jgi:hypothetical protein